jgi:hypothetical protein
MHVRPQKGAIVPTDKEIALQVADMKARGRDYGMQQIPGYAEWSERKLQEGESPAFIAHLDAGAMWLMPEELANVTEDEFEELLENIKAEVRKLEGDESI